MKRIAAIFFPLLAILISPPVIVSETWYAEGTWEYYYKIDANYFSQFQNQSFKQEKIKDYDDGTILARNTAILSPMPVQARFPVQIESGEKAFLTINYNKEAEIKYLKDFASSIVSDAKTVDVAVSRIAVWVRNNIRYQLGAPMDAIGVIKKKLAFCVGYAEVFIQLLRAVGIPARVLECYVPPGHGWGSGSSGGYHAFAEYYYPGAGWYCVDPQDQLNFTDPFHIVFCPYGNPRIKDVREVNGLFFVDKSEEPKSWYTYMAAAGQEHDKASFIFSIKKPSGDYYNFCSISFMSNAKKEESLSLFSYGAAYDGRGFTFERSRGSFSVINTNPGSRYMSMIYDKSSFSKTEFKDTLVVRAENCLIMHEIDFKGPARYFFETDLAEEPVKKLVFYDKQGKSMRFASVTFEIGSRSYSLTTDRDGVAFLAVPEKELECTFGGEKYRVTLSGKRAVRVPEKTVYSAEITALIAQKKLDASRGPVIAGVAIDETGVPSNSVFNRVFVWHPGIKPQILTPDENGIYVYTAKSRGVDHYIVASRANRHIKKKLSLSENKIYQVELDPFAEKMSVLGIEQSFESITAPLYEYLDRNTVVEYRMSQGRMLFSFPEESCIISDNDKAKNLFSLSVKKDVREYLYAPGRVSYGEFCSLKSRVIGNSFIAGSVEIIPVEIDSAALESAERIADETLREAFKTAYVRKSEYSYTYVLKEDLSEDARLKVKSALTALQYKTTPVRSGKVFMQNAGKRAIEQCEIEQSGFFTVRNLSPNSEYLFTFIGDNLLATKRLVTGEPSVYTVFIDNILEKKLLVPEHETDRFYRERYYRDAKEFYVLFPASSEGSLSLSSLPVKAGYEALNLFLDRGAYYFSPDKTLGSAVMVDASDKSKTSYFLFDYPGSENFISRKIAMYEKAYPQDTTAALIFLRLGKVVIKEKKASLRDEQARAKSLGFDKNGMCVIDDLARNNKYTFSFYDTGMGIEYPLSPENPGMFSQVIDGDAMPQTQFMLTGYDGSFSRVFPAVRNGTLNYVYEKCIPARNNSFRFYGLADDTCFMIGKNRLIGFFDPGVKEQKIDFKKFKTDSIAQYRKLFARFASGVTVLVFRLTSGGAPVSDYPFGIYEGKRKKIHKATSDGIGYVIDYKGEEALFETSGAGYFMRVNLGVERSVVNTFPLDAAKNANVKITKALKPKNQERSVYIFVDPVLEKGKIKKYKERFHTSTDSKGVLFLSLPEGEYAAEAYGRIKTFKPKQGGLVTIGFAAK